MVVGGTLVGTFGPGDTASRNVLLVTVAGDPNVHLGQLARGAGLAAESIRRMRRLVEDKGLEALVQRRWGGPRSEVPASIKRKLEALFEKGASVSEAHAALGKKGLSRSTVGRVRKQWAEGKEASAVRSGEAPPPPPQDTGADAAVALEADAPPSAATGEEASAPLTLADQAELTPRQPQSMHHIQHLGAWLLVAMTNALGMHTNAQNVAGDRVSRRALRLALDAVVVALGIGERCVEGVRRLATATAPALLLTTRAPSQTWLRRALGQFAAEGGSAALQHRMVQVYLSREREDAAAGSLFYVDNHMRPYTGKETVRKGWRMQDKRVLPGASDYYVHDEDGRPVFHHTAPEHGSLTEFLTPIARFLRESLGPDERIILAFDRAGSFATQLSELRNDGFEFVTYERRPYALLARPQFTKLVVLDKEKFWMHEERQKNLGKGRGRVRRICLLTEEGRQVNLVAVSSRPAEELVAVMRGRWRQENGFKHANERWGINQLDGRTVVPFSPDSVIPNPARRRLDNALRLARAREGELRNKLARLEADAPRRAKLAQELQDVVAARSGLEELHASTPKKAPLCETELADRLVHHELEYKLLLDTIRTACANAEAELAGMLGPRLPRATEAKKALANLFAAPGSLRVRQRQLTVTLYPAGTKQEQKAFQAMLRALSRRRLTLPGDQNRRALRFEVANVA